MEVRYTSRTLSITGLSRAFTELGNLPDSRCHFRMELKMELRALSSKSVMLMMLKWRAYRGVIWFRPPPGVPIAVTKMQSIMFRNSHSPVDRSYQPPWSMYWRRSSMGGWAP